MSEPFLTLEHDHGMDKEASKKHLADKVANNSYSIAGNEVSITWEGEKANVSVAGATGHIDFEDNKAILTVVDVPFAFRPMKGMIEGQIRGLMKQIYG